VGAEAKMDNYNIFFKIYIIGFADRNKYSGEIKLDKCLAKAPGLM